MGCLSAAADRQDNGRIRFLHCHSTFSFATPPPFKFSLRRILHCHSGFCIVIPVFPLSFRRRRNLYPPWVASQPRRIGKTMGGFAFCIVTPVFAFSFRFPIVTLVFALHSGFCIVTPVFALSFRRRRNLYPLWVASFLGKTMRGFAFCIATPTPFALSNWVLVKTHYLNAFNPVTSIPVINK